MNNVNKTLKKLILRILQGDNAAKEEFIEQFSPAIKKEASKVYLQSYTSEDLTQIGIVSLLESANKINLNKENLNISAYVYSTILNNYRYLIRKNINLNSISSLNNTSSAGNDVSDLIISNEDIEKEFEDKAMSSIIRQAINTLEPLEKALIEYMYLSEDKHYAIGFMEIHSLPYYKFTQIKTKALTKIAKFI